MGEKGQTRQLCRRCFLFLLICILVFSVDAQELHDGQKYMGLGRRVKSERHIATDDYIHFYQKFLSGARGSRCAMYPSCSNYGLMCFRERPFIEAMVMTADRMIRCGHDGIYYDLTYEYGYPALIDLPPFEPVPRSIVYTSQSYVLTDIFPCRNYVDSLRGFVHHLINCHHYDLALLEIERLSYFSPHFPDSLLYLQKLLCYDALNREEEGIFDFSVYQSERMKTDAAVLLQVAKMYYEVGNYRSAIDVLNRINTVDKGILYRNTVFKGLSFLRLGEEAAAAEQFSIVSPRYSSDVDLYSLNIQAMDDLSHQRKKKPWLAGVLSLMPGAGYFYDSQPASALTSLLVNGLLFYATYTSIKRENYGMAAVMGTFTLTFYTGNILGAIKGAKRYNERRIDACASVIEEHNHVY